MQSVDHQRWDCLNRYPCETQEQIRTLIQHTLVHSGNGY